MKTSTKLAAGVAALLGAVAIRWTVKRLSATEPALAERKHVPAKRKRNAQRAARMESHAS